MTWTRYRTGWTVEIITETTPIHTTMKTKKRGVAMIQKEILTLEPDCWGLGDNGLLIDDFKIEDNYGGLIPLEDENAINAILAPYIGTEVTIMQDDHVYAADGTYLGTYYV